MGMYQPYEKSEAFWGEARRVLEFAAMTLTAAGFRIRDHGETSLRAEASRTGDWNRCQALLRNVVSIEVRARGSSLTAHAELADYPVLQTFGGMVFGMIIALVMYHFFSNGARPMPQEFKHIFTVFIGLYFFFTAGSALTAVKWFRKSAWRSVDAFLHNLVIEAGGSGAS